MPTDGFPLTSPNAPPVHARVSLGALRRNIRALRSRLPSDTACAAVVKSDAYGHGMQEVARAAIKEGCRFLAVCSANEAFELRRLGFEQDVLILGPIFTEEAEAVVDIGAAATLGDLETARALDQAACRRGVRARVHVKVDTGMGRFGFLDSLEGFIFAVDKLLALKNLEIEGVWTHFSEADVPESDFTHEQARRFRTALRELEARRVLPRWVHAANSGAVAHFPEMSFSMARLGISMYGVYPGSPPETELALEPAMTVSASVAVVRDVPAGFPVSYGRTFVTERPSRLAVLPMGYGDGYPRHASGHSQVLLRGCRAPVVGRVTMNLTVVDATDVPGVRVGDQALLFGREGADLLRVEELAQAAGTLPHEILCNMGAHLPRSFTRA